jgi:O-antigen ligase
LVSELAISPDESYSRALPFLRFVLFAAAMQHCLLTERKSVRIFLSVLAATVGFVIVDCIYQYVMGQDVFGKIAEGQFRLSGPFNNDVAGTFIAKTSLPLLGWWFAWSASRGHLSWLVGGLLAALVGMTIMLTGERTALVTYGLGVFIVALSVRHVRLPLLLLGLIVVGGLGSAIATDQHLKERFIGHTISDVDDFWADRYGMIFVKAFEVWQQRPLVGVGLKNFRLACETANFEHQGPTETWCFTHPHNPYMELLSEAGIVGLLAFLVLFGLVARDLASGWRRDRTDYPLVIAASSTLVLFLWPIMVSPSIFSNWNGMLLWLSIGLALSLAKPRPAEVAGTAQ